jgi:hypothetical protein
VAGDPSTDIEATWDSNACPICLNQMDDPEAPVQTLVSFTLKLKDNSLRTYILRRLHFEMVR